MNPDQMRSFLNLFRWEVDETGRYVGDHKTEQVQLLVSFNWDDSITVVVSTLKAVSYQEWADSKWRDYDFRCNLKWTTPPLRPYCSEDAYKREGPREWINHEATIMGTQVNLLAWVVAMVMIERETAMTTARWEG